MKTINSLTTCAFLAITLLASSQLLGSMANPINNAITPKNPTGTVLTLNESYDGGSFTIPQGSIINVNLPSNAASTGYSWNWTSSAPDLLNYDNSCRPGSSTSPIGASAEELFAFRAFAAGAIVLTFSLQRPWEQNVVSVKEIHFNITIK